MHGIRRAFVAALSALPAVPALLLCLATPAALAADGSRLRVGVEGAYPPFSETDAKGNLKGFDIEIANALCTQMQAQCTVVQQDFDGLIPSLAARKFDFIVASVSITAEREKVVDFTEHYYRSDYRLVGKAGSPLDGSVKSLAGKKIGVQRSTISDRYATARFTDAQVVRYTTQDQAFLDLISGRIDATLCDTVVGDYGFLRTPTGKGYAFIGPELGDPQFVGKGVGIPIRKGDTALRDRLNAAIKAIRANGVYQKIQSKYFDFDIYGQ